MKKTKGGDWGKPPFFSSESKKHHTVFGTSVVMAGHGVSLNQLLSDPLDLLRG